MQRVSLDRANLPQTAVVVVATVAALGVLAFVVAYWARTWLVPHAAAPSAPVAVALEGAAADDLFGHVERNGGDSPNQVAIRLVGLVAAAKGHAGYAVLQLDARDFVAIREGEEVLPGIRLAEVGTDFAIIERHGSRETLVWPEKDSSGAPSPSEDAGSRS